MVIEKVVQVNNGIRKKVRGEITSAIIRNGTVGNSRHRCHRRRQTQREAIQASFSKLFRDLFQFMIAKTNTHEASL